MTIGSIDIKNTNNLMRCKEKWEKKEHGMKMVFKKKLYFYE